ncbi:MAG: hypothetical protein IJM62_06660 [Lachnospiraceae bacterium]|nr:hypothetical protein [Lachnospiraceae bacterium]
MLKKRFSTIALVLCVSMLLAACGGGSSDDGGGQSDTSKQTEAAAEYTGDKYTDNGSEFAIKTADLPEGYTPIPFDQFKEGFKALRDDDDAEMTYADVAKAFGDDGIRMDGIKYEGYAYYGWYSDQEYVDGVNTHILVTFKDNGGELTYYAYSAEGITGEDVQ